MIKEGCHTASNEKERYGSGSYNTAYAASRTENYDAEQIAKLDYVQTAPVDIDINIDDRLNAVKETGDDHAVPYAKKSDGNYTANSLKENVDDNIEACAKQTDFYDKMKTVKQTEDDKKACDYAIYVAKEKDHDYSATLAAVDTDGEAAQNTAQNTNLECTVPVTKETVENLKIHPKNQLNLAANRTNGDRNLDNSLEKLPAGKIRAQANLFYINIL